MKIVETRSGKNNVDSQNKKPGILWRKVEKTTEKFVLNLEVQGQIVANLLIEELQKNPSHTRGVRK